MNFRESDLALFSRFRIPLELIDEAGVCRVSDAEARNDFGLRGSGDFSGICFPYRSPITGQRQTARVRRDHPEVDSDGKVSKKYVAPYGDRRCLYFPPRAELFPDPAVPIVFTEGEKSALAMQAWSERVGRKLLCIALGGCWGWKAKVGIRETPSGERVPESGVLSDLNLAREGRKAYVLLDSNVTSNPAVAAAQASLVRQLRKQGAQAVVLSLPRVQGQNGPDDFLAEQGDDAMVRLFDGVIDGSVLANDLVAYLRDYIRTGEPEYIVLAVWIFHSHVISAMTRTPYLHVVSPVHDCGKTQLLEIMELVIPNGLLMSAFTPAVLARTIHEEQPTPTLLIDEFDQSQGGDQDLFREILKTLHSGYKASGKRIVMEGRTKDGKLQRMTFNTFCCKVIAGISKLPPTLESRCIPISMQRLAHGDKVEWPDQYVVEPRAAILKARLEDWGAQRIAELRHARPELEEHLQNRVGEIVRPLLAVSEVIGGSWPDMTKTAINQIMFPSVPTPEDDVRLELLEDIREAFEDRDKMLSGELTTALVNMPDRPWYTWSRMERPLNQNGLAKLLRDFKIYPLTMRTGTGRAKGYKREWFQPLWDRYLRQEGGSIPPIPPVTPGQPASTQEKTDFSDRDKDRDTKRDENQTVTQEEYHCHGSENVTPSVTVQNRTTVTAQQQDNKQDIRDCHGVTDVKGGIPPPSVDDDVPTESVGSTTSSPPCEKAVDDEDPFAIPPKEYHKSNVDWNDPFLRGLKLDDLDREPKANGDAAKSIPLLYYCPGCKGQWHSPEALDLHMQVCKFARAMKT